VLADCRAPVDDTAELAARLAATPGVVGHGLFEASLAWLILIGRGDGVQEISLR
jgi:ribose 5-phosphate isomerase